jgi:hypothetical protein
MSEAWIGFGISRNIEYVASADFRLSGRLFMRPDKGVLTNDESACVLAGQTLAGVPQHASNTGAILVDIAMSYAVSVTR